MVAIDSDWKSAVNLDRLAATVWDRMVDGDAHAAIAAKLQTRMQGWLLAQMWRWCLDWVWCLMMRVWSHWE
jgi:hypothetical protein